VGSGLRNPEPGGLLIGALGDTGSKIEGNAGYMRASIWRTVLAGAILVRSVTASAQALPTQVGTCVRTKIAAVEQRLRDGPNGPFITGSGSAVRFANGGYQVAYAEIDAVQSSQPGDPVLICLVRIPQHCPAGDARGRIYTTTNLRTLESWTMPDSEHKCGGA
jgi:hypothetical protein